MQRGISSCKFVNNCMWFFGSKKSTTSSSVQIADALWFSSTTRTRVNLKKSTRKRMGKQAVVALCQASTLQSTRKGVFAWSVHWKNRNSCTFWTAKTINWRYHLHWKHINHTHFAMICAASTSAMKTRSSHALNVTMVKSNRKIHRFTLEKSTSS